MLGFSFEEASFPNCDEVAVEYLGFRVLGLGFRV